jgi:hypothetical protein
MTTAESIRLDCLKFATECADNPTTVLDAARPFERFVTGSTATGAVRADDVESTDETDMENDGAVTSMLPDD